MRLKRCSWRAFAVAACMLLAVADAAAQKYSIQSAFYGADRVQKDVTARVRQLANGPNFTVNPRSLGIDPAPGRPKSLFITAISQNGTRSFSFKDGETVDSRMFSGAPIGGPGTPAGGTYPGPGYPSKPGGGYGSSLRILQATYGAQQGRRGTDVTSQLQRLVRNDRLNITVNNETLGGDPAVGQPKNLKVTYEYQGRRNTKTVTEYQRLTLP